jgi:hypothetical protein
MGGTVPTGNADTATASQYLQMIVEIAAGRAAMYDEEGTSAADAYVVALKTGQQGPASLFDGLEVNFTTAFTNTGAATIDVSLMLGETIGTTIVNIKLTGGADPAAGDIAGRAGLVYDLANGWFEVQVETSVDGLGYNQTWQVLTGSRAWGVTYTNTTGRPISVMSQPNTAVNSSLTLTVDGVIAWASAVTPSDTANIVTGIVPAGATYVVTRTAGTATLQSWSELR